MSLRSTAGAEGRMDLASLFCVIGRHGPAVAVAVVVLVSLLAGLILYRRGRRKRAADGEGGTGASPEESRSSAESTDVRDKGSSDVKEEDDLIPRDFKLRHRPAAAAPAAEKELPLYSPLNRDIHALEKRCAPSDGSEEMSVWHSCKATDAYAEETNQGLQSHASTTAEMEVEDDHRQGAAGGIFKDVGEQLHDYGSCWKEPVQIRDESHADSETALKAECQEDEDVASDKVVCSFNNHMETRSDSQPAPPINIDDVHAPSISCGKSEEENPQSIDCTPSSNNNRLCPEEENKSDSEKVVNECVDTQQAEILSRTSEEEPKLASAHQDQVDHVTDKAMPPAQDNVLDESDGQDGEVSEEVVEGDDLNTLGDGEVVTHSAQFNERGEEMDEQEEVRLECSLQDGVLYDGAGRGKEKMLTSDDTVISSQGCDGSSVSLSSLSVSMKVDIHDSGLSGVTTDAKAQISGAADSPDFSVGCQAQMEDKTGQSQNDDIEPTILSTQIPSQGTEDVPENIRDSSSMVLTEECDDHEHDPRGQSCYKDQKSNEGFEARVGPHPDAVDDEPDSAIAEEMRCHSPSVCEDRQSDGIENDDSSAADAVISDRLTARLTSEDLSQPDMMPFSHHQQSSLVENKEELSEVTSCAAPVGTGSSPPVCQIHLPSLGQSEQRNNDIASPGVGEESGISSLAVSPDSQEAGNEFDVAIGNVLDCDPQSEGQTEPQNSLFADDAASSVINEAGMEFGPYPSLWTPHSECAPWNTFESFAANEDMFGHEIEDGYHRVLDRFTTQISTSYSRFSHDLTIQTGMKTIIEVVEIKEEVKTGESVKQEEGTKADKQEKDDEKTEISIMEATMDYNEWITDSSYPVLPWLNLSFPYFGQDHTKTNQLPSDVCQDSSAVPDITYTEVKQTSTISLVDEITESSQKVVAVQPMPQSVKVTFQVHYYTTSPYQTVAVTGNQQELGNWKRFIPLESAKDGHWTTEVSLPAESHVEWKFVLLDKGEVCRWEECDNRLLDTGYGDSLLVHKWWGLL